VILYVNGDSHTAAAEAVNAHAFAEDDPLLNYLGRLPHPANLSASWGRKLADILKAGFTCGAESAASNTRIMRTTRQWLLDHPTAYRDSLVIIQWSTWERQEWLIDGEYFQVNASGVDVVPESHQQQYKEYIAGIRYPQVMIDAHEDIWNFHQSLNLMGVKHIFFNGNSSFEGWQSRKDWDWGTSYIKPYDAAGTYHGWLRNNGFETVSKGSWHFGKEAHSAWARYVLQYIIDNKLI
jgi:hypothetical protein